MQGHSLAAAQGPPAPLSIAGQWEQYLQGQNLLDIDAWRRLLAVTSMLEKVPMVRYISADVLPKLADHSVRGALFCFQLHAAQMFGKVTSNPVPATSVRVYPVTLQGLVNNPTSDAGLSPLVIEGETGIPVGFVRQLRDHAEAVSRLWSSTYDVTSYKTPNVSEALQRQPILNHWLKMLSKSATSADPLRGWILSVDRKQNKFAREALSQFWSNLAPYARQLSGDQPPTARAALAKAFRRIVLTQEIAGVNQRQLMHVKGRDRAIDFALDAKESTPVSLCRLLRGSTDRFGHAPAHRPARNVSNVPTAPQTQGALPLSSKQRRVP